MLDHTLVNKENKNLKEKIKKLENKLQQLDLQYFYFKTLYDVNQEIGPLNNTEGILKAFLMMIMGTFGIFQGFIILVDKEFGKIDFFESRYKETDVIQPIIEFFKDKDHMRDIFSKETPLSFFDQQLFIDFSKLNTGCKRLFDLLMSADVTTFLPFKIDERFSGAIGLSRRITGESFSQIDRELLSTLLNQLSTNILNAKSFEIIQDLNVDLQIKNKTLEETLKKIQLLEKAKALLCKFVPKSLEKLIEDHPESPDLGKKEHDITILFLDIEGFTAMSEDLKYVGISRMIETYFSRFFDDIHRYGGDINMTAGDGLMIIFQNKDKKIHAVNAVKTALAIRKKTKVINAEVKDSDRPLVINIGIHSGVAMIGATRLEGYYGSRWTYTALGSTVNIASRIGSYARNGEILLSNKTASRIRNEFSIQHLGPQKFKNVKKEISIYRVIDVIDHNH